MHRVLRKAVALLVLAAGLTMLVCGWRAFKEAEPAPAPDDGEAIARMCPPDIGEAIGPVGRKLGCLFVTLIGMAASGGSVLMLIQKRKHT